MKKATKPPATIDEYLAPLTAAERKALGKLRKDIRAAAPGAVECISYGIPAFRLGGKFLVAFGAAAKHLSFYPGSSVSEFESRLKGYSTSKGTVRFSAAEGLPTTLVKALVKAKIAKT